MIPFSSLRDLVRARCYFESRATMQLSLYDGSGHFGDQRLPG